MGVAEASEKTGSYLNDPAEDEFPRVLESATKAILNAEAFRKPYPLIRFRDFFPSDFYARLVQRFPDVDRFAGLNGDGTRREYALYDERSDPGSEESRALWGIVRRVLASTEIASALREKLDEGFRIRSKRSGEGLADPDASAAGALHRPQRLRDQAPSRHPPEGPDDADLPASGRLAARAWHDHLQDLADGRSSLGNPMVWRRTRHCPSCRTRATRSSSSTRLIRS